MQLSHTQNVPMHSQDLTISTLNKSPKHQTFSEGWCKENSKFTWNSQGDIVGQVLTPDVCPDDTLIGPWISRSQAGKEQTVILSKTGRPQKVVAVRRLFAAFPDNANSALVDELFKATRERDTKTSHSLTFYHTLHVVKSKWWTSNYTWDIHAWFFSGHDWPYTNSLRGNDCY